MADDFCYELAAIIEAAIPDCGPSNFLGVADRVIAALELERETRYGLTFDVHRYVTKWRLSDE